MQRACAVVRVEAEPKNTFLHCPVCYVYRINAVMIGEL
jgi:hypothetical protein